MDQVMYRHVIKRMIDVVLSIIGLIVLAIPMVIIAIVINLDSKGGAIFTQKRMGKNKKPLHEGKFYTGHYGAKIA
jgi:O-antigen biosynthesis protein WbqP